MMWEIYWNASANGMVMKKLVFVEKYSEEMLKCFCNEKLFRVDVTQTIFLYFLPKLILLFFKLPFTNSIFCYEIFVITNWKKNLTKCSPHVLFLQIELYQIIVVLKYHLSCLWFFFFFDTLYFFYFIQMPQTLDFMYFIFFGRISSIFISSNWKW